MTAVSTSNARTHNAGQFEQDDPLVAVTYHQSYPFVRPDDTSDNNSQFIAASNPSTILQLLDLIESQQAELSRREAVSSMDYGSADITLEEPAKPSRCVCCFANHNPVPPICHSSF
jgi:hypothetical protein